MRRLTRHWAIPPWGEPSRSLSGSDALTKSVPAAAAAHCSPCDDSVYGLSAMTRRLARAQERTLPVRLVACAWHSSRCGHCLGAGLMKEHRAGLGVAANHLGDSQSLTQAHLDVRTRADSGLARGASPTGPSCGGISCSPMVLSSVAEPGRGPRGVSSVGAPASGSLWPTGSCAVVVSDPSDASSR